MHFSLIYISVAVLIALPFYTPDIQAQETESKNPQQIAKVSSSDDDFFDDEEEDEIIIQPINEDVEEADIVDQRPQKEKTIELVKPEETDEEKYTKAKMAFLFGQYEMAYRVWVPLANKGHAKSQANLGWMFHTGKGVKKDLATAREWYEKAAKQGHSIALNNLGVFYEQGLSVHKSLSDAAHWYTESAEYGYSYGQYNLGVMYQKGKGVEKDINLAIYWFQLAALQGVEQAQTALDALSKSKKSSHPSTKIKPDKEPEPQSDDLKWERVPHGQPGNPTAAADRKEAEKTHNRLYQQLYHKKRPTAPVATPAVKPAPEKKAASKPEPATKSAEKPTVEKEAAKNKAGPGNAKPSALTPKPVASKANTQATKPATETPVSTKKPEAAKAKPATVSSETAEQKTVSEAKPKTNKNNDNKETTPEPENQPDTKPDKTADKNSAINPDLLKEKSSSEQAKISQLIQSAEIIKQTIADSSWIKQQNPKHYTLQIAGSNDLNKLLELARSSSIASELAYYKTTRKGRVWYSLVYGSFSKFSEANKVAKTLPGEFKEWSPWVRKISAVQAKITDLEITK